MQTILKKHTEALHAIITGTLVAKTQTVKYITITREGQRCFWKRYKHRVALEARIIMLRRLVCQIEVVVRGMALLSLPLLAVF